MIVKTIRPYVILHRDPITGIAWIADGTAGIGISCHPNISASGNAKAMKALGYWERRDRTAECRGFIYNLDSLVVHGTLERGGDVRCAVVPNYQINTLQARVREHIAPGTQLYTDALKSYKGLDVDYLHAVIDHAHEYVRGRVHTNGLENFWSLLKRAIKGTYVAVDAAHLDRYLDEQTFRFNKRKGSDATRFLEVILSTVGKRLTYSELTAAAK